MKAQTPHVRTSLHQVDPAMLERLNEGRSPAERFRPAEEELRLLALTAPDRYTVEEAKRWAEHPDERVTLLFSRLVALSGAESRYSAAGRIESLNVYALIAERAMREADQAGELWSPMLDVVTDTFATNWQVRNLLDVEKRLKKLQHWIRGVKDPAQLEFMAEFASGAIRYTQLEHAQTLPEHQLAYWIRFPTDAMHVLRNSRLMLRHGPAVLLHILQAMQEQQIRSLEGEMAEMPATYFRHAPAGFADEVARLCLEGHNPSTLTLLLPKLRGFSPEAMESILEYSRYFGELLGAAATHPDVPADFRARLLGGAFGFPAAILSHPQADPELLATAWERAGESVSVHVVLHPNVPDQTAIEVIQSWEQWPQRLELPVAASRGAVALALLERAQSHHLPRLLDLLVRAPAEDPLAPLAFAEVAERVLDANPREVLEQLENRLLTAPEVVLERETLARVLAHSKPEIREMGVRLQGRVRPPSEAERELRATWQREAEEAIRAQQARTASRSKRDSPRPRRAR